MKIPNSLPHFAHETLFVVTGKQIGKLYLASNDVMREIAIITEPKLHYSDDEGLFMRGGSGKTYGAGSVKEPKDAETKRKFLKKLSAEVKGVMDKEEIAEVYIFTPSDTISELKEALPTIAREKLNHTFRGNFVKFSPQELLSKVDDQLQRTRSKKQPLKPEEAKILDHPKGSAKTARQHSS